MPKPRFNIYDKTWTPEVARKIEDNFKQLSRVSGSQIYNNTIEPEAVKAGLLFNQMSTGAIKFLGFSYRSDTQVCPGWTANVWVDYKQDDDVTPVQITATTEGGDVYVYAQASLWSADTYKKFRVVCDGNATMSPSQAVASYLTNAVCSSSAIFKKSNLTAGSHTFKLQHMAEATHAGCYRNATLFAIEVKS